MDSFFCSCLLYFFFSAFFFVFTHFRPFHWLFQAINAMQEVYLSSATLHHQFELIGHEQHSFSKGWKETLSLPSMLKLKFSGQTVFFSLLLNSRVWAPFDLFTWVCLLCLNQIRLNIRNIQCRWIGFFIFFFLFLFKKRALFKRCSFDLDCRCILTAINKMKINMNVCMQKILVYEQLK